VTKVKRVTQRPNLLASLERFAEVLPSEKLRTVQKLYERDALTDEILVKEIGETGLLLAAFGSAASSVATILQTAPANIATRIQALREHVNSTAPALFNYPRIKALAQRFVETAPSNEEQRDKAFPFDDIDGFRAATTYLDRDGEFTPTVRLEVTFTNRAALPALSLRLVDVAFLASSLLGSLAAALESSARLSPLGLLDESELDGARAHLESFTNELDRIRSILSAPSAVSNSPT
jgi:hypothetical protein